MLWISDDKFWRSLLNPSHMASWVVVKSAEAFSTNLCIRLPISHRVDFSFTVCRFSTKSRASTSLKLVPEGNDLATLLALKVVWGKIRSFSVCVLKYDFFITNLGLLCWHSTKDGLGELFFDASLVEGGEDLGLFEFAIPGVPVSLGASLSLRRAVRGSSLDIG